MKTGYSIKTWKMRLFCPEKQMIETTEALYREAVAFYYELLKESEELWSENLLTIQGHLEKLTVPGRDGREPKYIPPGGKLPVYFRRSAMNKAAMAVKTAASAESFPEKIDANITFFKGMYRDLTDTSVVLKLWNGKKWIWVLCGLTGRPFPKEAAILSPTLVHEEKWLMFHVPVKQENSDARTAKERMQEGARVCSVRFTNTDSFAVCAVLDEGSRQLAVKNCRGGNAYRHHCKALLKKVEASRAFTDKDNVSQPNRKYYMHLKPDAVYILHEVNHLSPSIIRAAKKEGVRVVHRISDFFMFCPKYDFLCENEICEACLHGDYRKAIEHRCVKGSKAGTLLRVLAMKIYAVNRVFDDVDQYICTCEFSKNKLIEGGIQKEKITCIPTFIDATSIIPCYENNKYFLFLGRMAHQKGTIYAIEAMKYLRDTDYVLKITGQISDSQEDQEIWNYIKDNKLEDKIVFTGFKHGNELQEFCRC